MIFSIPKLGKYVLNKEFRLTPGGLHPSNLSPIQRMMWRGYDADITLEQMYDKDCNTIIRPNMIVLPVGTIFILKHIKMSPSATYIGISIPAKYNSMLRNKPDIEAFFTRIFNIVHKPNVDWISRYIMRGTYNLSCNSTALNGIDCEEYDDALGKSSMV